MMYEGIYTMLLESIKAEGIIGCGGAVFPAHVKLNCTVEYLIVNATECEPLLRTDRRFMIHKAKEIVVVTSMIGNMVQAGKRYIALKETYQRKLIPWSPRSKILAVLSGFTG